MKEMIILAPGANGNELRKSLAMHGRNTFNLRIIGSAEFAGIALMRSGKAITKDYITPREEIAIISEAIKGVEYFKIASYSDIQEIARAVRKIRCLVPNENESEEIRTRLGKGIFENKNQALVSVYEKYTQILEDRNLTDTASLLRMALVSCIPSDETEFYYLDEYPLNPLEKALLDRFSDGKAQDMSLRDLFGADKNTYKIRSYKNCYGASNEVESILSDIYSGKNPDKCTVAVTDPATYGQLFFDYAVLYDLPVSLGCGIPITNSNPAKLLTLYRQWISGGEEGDVFGGFILCKMLTSNAFDGKALANTFADINSGKEFEWMSYLGIIEDLRLTNNKDVNDKQIEAFSKAVEEDALLVNPKDETAVKEIEKKKRSIPYLKVLSNVLCLSPEEFIGIYSYIREGTVSNAGRLIRRLDKAAQLSIYNELKLISSSGIGHITDDMFLNILKMMVSTGGSEEGKLYVCSIDSAIFSIRENLYIAGLSATKYPGSPKENYLLLDDDLQNFESNYEHMTSRGRIKLKRERLFLLANLASSLNAEVNVSYSGLNVSELKKDNPSSLLFELRRRETGKIPSSEELKKTVKDITYFEPAISPTRKIGEAYNDDRLNVLPHESEDSRERVEIKCDLEKAEFSPSALDVYFNCARAFFLKYIIGLSAPDDNRPFEVIGGNESGSLAHGLMERIANKKVTLEDFLKLSAESFDRFIAQHPPLIEKSAENEKIMFLEMMETAYKMVDHSKEVVLREEDIHFKHKASKVRLHGFPDRVEKDDSGSYLIVDFKSSRSTKHIENDINTCLQIVIYAFLMTEHLKEQGNPGAVTGGEFRYIRLNDTVSCVFDDEMKDLLNEKLTIFKTSMEQGIFAITPKSNKANRTQDEEDPCKYCKFGMVCGKMR